MRVLITGGGGFIGSHAVDLLLQGGAEVRVLDTFDRQVHGDHVPDYLAKNIDLVTGDVRNGDTVRRALRGVDRVVHLAAAVGIAQSMYEIVHYTSVNTLGAAVLLEEASRNRDQLEKVVVASSMSIYGEGLYFCTEEQRRIDRVQRGHGQLEQRRWDPECPSCGCTLQALPTPETKSLEPASIYAIGKRDHEEMFLVWGNAYGVPVTALRFFNVYGPRQSLSNPYTGVAAIFASRLLNGKPPLIFEDGLQSRDFVHVSDVAASVRRALEPGSGDGQSLNVGTGVATTIREVADVLGKALGSSVEPEVRNDFRVGDIRHCFADIARAREVLGYEPAVTFEKGMAELCVWLADQVPIDRVEEATDALVARGLAG